MKRISITVFIFIMLFCFTGCMQEIADQAEDVSPSPTVSQEPEIIKYTVPRQTQNPQEEQAVEEIQEVVSYPTVDLPESIDPLGAFADKTIFTDPIDVVAERYGVSKGASYGHERYQVDDLLFCSYPAVFEFSGYMRNGEEVVYDYEYILPLDNMLEHEMQAALSDVFEELTQALGEPIMKDYYYCSWDSQSDDEVRVVAYYDDNEGWIRINCRANYRKLN